MTIKRYDPTMDVEWASGSEVTIDTAVMEEYACGEFVRFSDFGEVRMALRSALRWHTFVDPSNLADEQLSDYDADISEARDVLTKMRD